MKKNRKGYVNWKANKPTQSMRQCTASFGSSLSRKGLMGVHPFFSIIFLILIIVVGITMVLGIGNPLINAALDTTKVNEAESAMKFLEHYTNEVASEGIGAAREAELVLPGEFEVIPEEDSIEYEIITPARVIDHFTRKVEGNLIYISGSDVDCDDTINLTMSNSFINITLNKITKTTPHSTINTQDNIISVIEKTHNTTAGLSNSSIIINDNLTSSYGTGYSEISRTGKQLPVCQAHFFIISSYANYDVYYILYAGADFVVIDIRNVEKK